MSHFNSNYSASLAAADALISITQDTSQAYLSEQNIKVNCSSEDKQKGCDLCIDNLLKINKKLNDSQKYSSKEMKDLCEDMCQCKVSNVNMEKNVIINMESLQRSDISQIFEQRYKDNILQQIKDNSGSIKDDSYLSPNTDSSNTNIQVNKLLTAIKSESFQSSIQNLKDIQAINVDGPVLINGLDLHQSIRFISKILETNDMTSSHINDLQVEVIQATTQITTAGIGALIGIIVQIILFILIIMLLFYSSNLIFQVYTLIVNY